MIQDENHPPENDAPLWVRTRRRVKRVCPHLWRERHRCGRYVECDHCHDRRHAGRWFYRPTRVVPPGGGIDWDNPIRHEDGGTTYPPRDIPPASERES